MLPYPISAAKTTVVPRLDKWLGQITKVLVMPRTAATPVEVVWKFQSLPRDLEGAGLFDEKSDDLRVLNGDFEVWCPKLSEMPLEKWFLAPIGSMNVKWQLLLVDILDAGLLLKSQRNYPMLKEYLKTIFDEVSIDGSQINKLAGVRYMKRQKKRVE